MTAKYLIKRFTYDLKVLLEFCWFIIVEYIFCKLPLMYNVNQVLFYHFSISLIFVLSVHPLKKVQV